jgi:hypothetical protein
MPPRFLDGSMVFEEHELPVDEVIRDVVGYNGRFTYEND